MKTALVTMAKDEEKYIEEWLAYNLKLGFDKVIVIKNNWHYHIPVDNNRILQLTYDGQYKQVEAYNHMIDLFYEEFDFIAFFDVDEFLVLKQHENINDFLENYVDFPAICVNWRMFGDSNLNGNNLLDRSVINRFVMCENKLSSCLKNIINTRKMKNTTHFTINSHCTNTYMIDPNKKMVLKCFGDNPKINEDGNEEIAELFHYRTKTWEEYKERHLLKDICDSQDSLTLNANKNDITLRKLFDDFNKNSNQVVNNAAKDFFNK